MRRHTVFENTLPNRDREIALFCIARIIRDYQRRSNRFYFKELELIRLGDNVPLHSGTVGLMTAVQIYTTWSGIPTAIGADSRLVSHELAHYYFLKLFEGIPGREKDWKNLVHYADNVGPPYVKSIDVRYTTWSDRFLRRKGTVLRLFMLDIEKILADRDRIISEINTGLAPQGTNRYFPT